VIVNVIVVVNVVSVIVDLIASRTNART